MYTRLFGIILTACISVAQVSGEDKAPADSLSVNPSSVGQEKSPLLERKITWEKNNKYLKVSVADSKEKEEYKRWTGLKYSGYIRSYNQYRFLPTRYEGQPVSEHLFTVNGLDVVSGAYTGYQEPLFLLRAEGSPTARTWFQIEYMFDNQLTGKIREDSTAGQVGIGSNLNRRALLYRILQFKAYANTTYGDYTLIAGGGVNWYKLSPFTLWNYEYRDDMFERYPWQPEGSSFGLYSRYYTDQRIARDARWGNTATQGFILNGKNLPGGIGFSYIYGKTDNSGGFQTYLTRTPKNMMSGRIDKGLGSHLIGFNYFSQFGAYNARGFDYRNNSPIGTKLRQQIVTADARINFVNLKIFVEAGMGRFQDGIIDKKTYEFLFDKTTSQDSITGLNYNWNKLGNSHALNVQFDFSKELTYIPLSLQFFSVGKTVLNVNSQTLNSANNHSVATPANIGTAFDATTFPGALTDIGQMTNNRRGVYLKHEDTYGKFKLSIANGINQEIDTLGNIANAISFWHQSNSFSRSRFAYFQALTGPYSRITSMFRRTYEIIQITDTIVDYKKVYNMFNLGVKYKLKLFKKELILAGYVNYNSVQDKFSPIPLFNDDAFLRVRYEEFMFFYSLAPRLTVLGFGSRERALGNNRTELADANGDRIVNGAGKAAPSANGKPIDQTGYGYGLGVDYDFAGRAGLYLRHRWFEHSDKNFTKDKFKGQETTVELKIFF